MSILFYQRFLTTIHFRRYYITF